MVSHLGIPSFDQFFHADKVDHLGGVQQIEEILTVLSNVQFAFDIPRLANLCLGKMI
jgi:hypothetical protein